MIPKYQENELYYFDEAAADAPCRFTEKFVSHFEGQHAGKQFLLQPWQRQLIRTLHGWKRRSDNRRRFSTLYLIGAKGLGKTPLLSAIGGYHLIGAGEAAPHIISMASDARQAKLTFDFATNYIKNSPDLFRFATPQQHLIKVAKGKSKDGKWNTISGKPTGVSGVRPSVIIADELQEWGGVTANAFNLLKANCFKRSDPLIIMATNAGKSHNCFAWEVHERALKVLNGELADDTLLPVIFEAPDDLPWDSEEAHKASNPSLGSFIKFDQLAPNIASAKESKEKELEHKRLYLSKWPSTTIGSWLDMDLWRSNVAPFDPATLKDAVLYHGLDLSLCDDLSAAVTVYGTAEKFYIDSHFWIPRAKAEEYEQKFMIPFTKWEGEGKITLVNGPTIDTATRLQIAAYITAKKTGKTKGVFYDPNKAEEVIAVLEAAGVPCVPVSQGWTLTPGCEELDRRLREKTIQINPSGPLEFCATNAQVVRDQRGNYWPVKPGAKGKWAGTPHKKIDGVIALVTALTEARKYSFPAARKMWMGGATIIKAAPAPVPTQRPLLVNGRR